MARLTAKARKSRHLQCRLPVGLHRTAVNSAKAAGRSLNAEIVFAVEQSCNGSLAAAMNRLAAAIEEANRPKFGLGQIGSLGSYQGAALGSMCSNLTGIGNGKTSG